MIIELCNFDYVKIYIRKYIYIYMLIELMVLFDNYSIKIVVHI